MKFRNFQIYLQIFKMKFRNFKINLQIFKMWFRIFKMTLQTLYLIFDKRKEYRELKYVIVYLKIVYSLIFKLFAN